MLSPESACGLLWEQGWLRLGTLAVALERRFQLHKGHTQCWDSRCAGQSATADSKTVPALHVPQPFLSFLLLFFF